MCSLHNNIFPISVCVVTVVLGTYLSHLLLTTNLLYCVEAIELAYYFIVLDMKLIHTYDHPLTHSHTHTHTHTQTVMIPTSSVTQNGPSPSSPFSPPTPWRFSLTCSRSCQRLSFPHGARDNLSPSHTLAALSTSRPLPSSCSRPC